MGVEFIQSDLTGGEISPSLHARTDIDKYKNSVAEAKNVVIVPQGGLRRRPGLAKTAGGYYTEEVRIEPFIFNQTQKYVMIFRPGFIDIMRDGALVAADIVFPFASLEIIDDLDIIQSADTVIITHDTYTPQKLVRGVDDTIWTLSDISLTIPLNAFPPTYTEVPGTPQVVDLVVGDTVLAAAGTTYQSKLVRSAIDLDGELYTDTTNWTALTDAEEAVWSDYRGYPGVCTFHGGRLWLAGSTQKPTSVWASRINDYFDFTWVETSGSIPDDHAIFDTIETNEYNKIVNIFTGRNIQVFTTGAEFINGIEFPTPSNSAWKQQTGYGSKRLRPILIDGATLYVDSSNRTIRQFIFDFNEDSFVSNNITLLASHLLTDIKAIRAIKGTSLDVSDYVYAVNTDGTIAVMNTLRSEGLLGWTHWETQGEFLDVCVLSKEVYFLVKREDVYFIEMLEEGTYTDHNVLVNGIEPPTNNIIDGEDNIIDNGFNIVDTNIALGTPITSITTDYKDLFLNTYFKVIADYSIMTDTKPTTDGVDLNHFNITRDAYRLEVGLDFDTIVKMLPISSDTQTGNTLHRRKRVVKVDVNVLETLGIYVSDIYAADRQFPIVLDKAPEPFTGFKEVHILGYQRLYQFQITQKNPLPMLIRAISFEVAY